MRDEGQASLRDAVRICSPLSVGRSPRLPSQRRSATRPPHPSFKFQLSAFRVSAFSLSTPELNRRKQRQQRKAKGVDAGEGAWARGGCASGYLCLFVSIRGSTSDRNRN